MTEFLQSLLLLICRQGKDDDKSKERVGSGESDRSSLQQYDPRCHMSREEYEWRCDRAETVDQLMPQMLEKLDVLLQMTRPHFLDDPDDTLNMWDDYEEHVRYAFKNNLRSTLMAPVSIPNSVAYEHLMRRKVCSRTLVGRVSGELEKLKQVATEPTKKNKRSVRSGVIVAGVATAFAIGIAVGRRIQLHETSKQKANEMGPK